MRQAETTRPAVPTFRPSSGHSHSASQAETYHVGKPVESAHCVPDQAELLPGFQGRLPPVPLSEAAKQACQAAMLGAASAKLMRRLLRSRNLLKVLIMLCRV